MSASRVARAEIGLGQCWLESATDLSYVMCSRITSFKIMNDDSKIVHTKCVGKLT